MANVTTNAASDPLAAIDDWPVPNAAAGWMTIDGRGGRRGPTDRVFALASLTKPLFALAVLVGVEEGTLALDEPTTEGLTVRQLLSHAAGLGPETNDAAVAPETRRIYSNAGFDVLGRLLSEASGLTAAEYFRLAVAEPLGLTSTRLEGSPAHGAVSTVDDMLSVLRELMAPTLLHSSTMAASRTPQFPELAGVLPGYGRHVPNPWGLGFEIRGTKSPHWTGDHNSPETYGHFGRAGTMFWADPARGLGCVTLTDRPFGPWAATAWPPLSDAVIGATAVGV